MNDIDGSLFWMNRTRRQKRAKRHNPRTENCSEVTAAFLSLSVLKHLITNQQYEFTCLTNISSIELFKWQKTHYNLTQTQSTISPSPSAIYLTRCWHKRFTSIISGLSLFPVHQLWQPPPCFQNETCSVTTNDFAGSLVASCLLCLCWHIYIFGGGIFNLAPQGKRWYEIWNACVHV